MRDLPKQGRTFRIWKVVEELILGRLDTIQANRMRDGYYLLREWLEPMRADGTIFDREYDYFSESYEYYRDDFWPRLEKRHGIRRPMTKPPTIVIEDGREYTEAHIDEAWDRSRGFIFVEKSGMASDLSILSEHGWLIVAAQGESTRTFREKVAADGTDRPVLAVTDADYYGDGIEETLMGHSNRTEHLALWRELDDRIQTVGLTRPDAAAMDLPRERDPTKSPDEWRVELNALAVLGERHGIEVPLLSYITAKMRQLDIPLCPLPDPDPEDRVYNNLRRALIAAMESTMETVIDDILSDNDAVDDVDQEGTGPLMQLRYHESDEQADLSELEDELSGIAKGRFDGLVWWRQTRYEQNVVYRVGREDVQTVEAMLG